MNFILPWEHWNASDKRKLLRELPNDATHEAIETELLKFFPGESVDNNEFHVLVTEVIAHLRHDQTMSYAITHSLANGLSANLSVAHAGKYAIYGPDRKFITYAKNLKAAKEFATNYKAEVNSGV